MVRNIHTSLKSMFRNYQNVVQAFLHRDSFYSFPPTIRDTKQKQKTKETKTPTQPNPTQPKNLKLPQRSKVLTPILEASSIRLETFTTKRIYTNNMMESMCESLCFQSPQECNAHYRWSKDIHRLEVTTVSSAWMGATQSSQQQNPQSKQDSYHEWRKGTKSFATYKACSCSDT